ncbi:MAG: TetR/AcrR family transcriptional regulator [Lachnospiraceae bacterium]|nr:TetR/AcrR family transcriptional regulator [Lachnospiraceae bacterium]
MRDSGSKEEKRIKILEDCFDCFCRHGLENTNAKQLGEACGMSPGNLFNNYFENKDQIIIESTAWCMAKVEDDFMAQAPRSMDEVERYIMEMPYRTARMHGAQYRFMYQVYASPRYREYGREFFQGVTERYAEYSRMLAPGLGIPWETLQAMIFIFVRACVHYAMFENEEYLKPQLEFLLKILRFMKESDMGKNKSEKGEPS